MILNLMKYEIGFRFHLLDLGAALLLLALGFLETPSLSMLEVPTQVSHVFNID
jgi:hypothetical protein